MLLCSRDLAAWLRGLILSIVLMSAVLAVSAARAAAAPDLRGVQLHSLWGNSSDADIDRELEMSKQANANVVRIDVGWSSLEADGKGQFNQWYLNRVDRFMSGAQARGIKVIATLWTTPCWASSAPESLKQGCTGAWWDRGPIANYPPTNNSDYADITRWFVARYGSKLAAVEVWNEPNNLPDQGSQYWKTTTPVADYTNLLKAAYPAAKAANASVPVLAGSISGNDRVFLSALYAAGAKGFYDGLAIHPYNDTGFTDLKLMHAVQTAVGDTAPIWVTEFGFPTGTASQWHVSETAQANGLTQSFTDLNALPWIKSAIVYQLRDKGTSVNAMEDNFGLLRRDYTPKPAYNAVKGALSGTATGTPTAAPRRTTRPRRLTLRTVRKNGHVFALLAAKPNGRVRLAVGRCARARRARVMTVRLNRLGRAVRRVGTTRTLAGCRLNARLV